MREEFKKETRASVIGVLGICAFLCILAEPSGAEHRLLVFLATKAAAVILGMLAYILWRHWEPNGKLSEFNDKV